MTTARRWWCVGIGVLLLLAAPVLVSALPASDAAVPATVVLDRIEQSQDRQFSGYVETEGNVAVPESEELSSLSKLVGSTNRLRVWWRDSRTWRVSTLRTSGETDLVHSENQTTTWVYESRDVTITPDLEVRLPTTVDLVPNELARRVLEGARPEELTRLPARRVAGRDALGLRLTPADRQASIGHVDVYADSVTGLPLQVELFARGGRFPAISSALVDVSFDAPDADALSFEPPCPDEVRYDNVVDIASAADRFAARVPPSTLAGLPSRGDAQGSVRVYGRGPTVLLAVPLWSRTSHRVRDDLENRPAVRQIDQGYVLAAPPLRMLLADPGPNDTSWLLMGTVTQQALQRAADELAADRPGLRFP